MSCAPRTAAAAGPLLLFLLGAGCLEGRYPCSKDAECTYQDRAGTCEPAGYCSFPDKHCTSGQRYGRFSAEPYRDRCVGDEEEGPCVRRIAVGGRHSCALVRGGGVWCWGDNGRGQLGDGQTIDATTPVRVIIGEGGIAFTQATQISAGSEHTCARRMDGTAWCWGNGELGRLGNGGTQRSTKPVQVLAAANMPLMGIVFVTAGTHHTCAVGEDASLWCWGGNGGGQLGNGGTMASPFATRVMLGEVEEASAGDDFTCALRKLGSVYCWGVNNFRQTGLSNPATTMTVLTPTLLLMTDIVQVRAGGAHGCSRNGKGSVVCWGRSVDGQAGRDASGGSSGPVLVPFPAGVTAVGLALGEASSCALTAEGRALCWGRNAEGQVGDGTMMMRNFPVPVLLMQSGGPPLDGLAEIAAGPHPYNYDGGRHVCARKADGRVYCWGRNLEGQLGNGTTAMSLGAVDVKLSDVCK